METTVKLSSDKKRYRPDQNAGWIYKMIKTEDKTMADLKTPFRYDYVGSFLRPEVLKQARKNFEEGKITKEQLTAVEDDCIRDLVGKIKKLGYHVITDGEFRRSTWHLDFMWGFDGVAHENTGNGVKFDAELAVLDDTYLVGKIKAKPHPFVEGFRFLKQFEDETRLQNIRSRHQHRCFSR